MAASAARVVQATHNNAALAEQHGVAAAAFSRRAAAEIERLRAEQETLNATRAEISSLHAAAIAAAEQERDSASREIGTSRAAQAAATAKHSAKMVAAENALQSKLAALGRERQQQDDAHVAGLAAHTASTEAKIAAMYAEHETAMAASKKQFDDGIAAKEARLAALEATERDVQARAAALQKRAGEAIELNVGGQRFACSVSAFSRAPESVLAVMVAQHSSKAEPLFIDTDPTHWQHVLTYLRRGAIPFLSEFDPITLASLESDAGYFKLAELEQLCKMARVAREAAAQSVADAKAAEEAAAGAAAAAAAKGEVQMTDLFQRRYEYCLVTGSDYYLPLPSGGYQVYMTAVQEKLDSGWHVLGGVAASTYNPTKFTQAFIRFIDECEI